MEDFGRHPEPHSPGGVTRSPSQAAQPRPRVPVQRSEGQRGDTEAPAVSVPSALDNNRLTSKKALKGVALFLEGSTRGKNSPGVPDPSVTEEISPSSYSLMPPFTGTKGRAQGCLCGVVRCIVGTRAVAVTSK